MDKNYIKKELMKSKEMASFSHYIAGNMYYHVKVGHDVYQFPIPTVTEETGYNLPENPGEDEIMYEYIKLSDDLGTTSFTREMRGSYLNRWVGKAIDNDEFIEVEVAVSPI